MQKLLKWVETAKVQEMMFLPMPCKTVSATALQTERKMLDLKYIE
jgi:hypothetical protein